MIEHYLTSIRIAVGTIATAHVDYYRERRLGDRTARLYFRLSWPDSQVMEVGEVLESDPPAMVWLNYRYHFQSRTIVPRYDKAPHHAHLSTHPEHRHLNEATEAAARPSLLSFLDEVRHVSGLW